MSSADSTFSKLERLQAAQIRKLEAEIERLNAIAEAARNVYFGPAKGSQAVRYWRELGAVLGEPGHE